jgi:hypothetical protein
VPLEHKEEPIDPDRLESILEKSFLTESGKVLARKVLLK